MRNLLAKQPNPDIIAITQNDKDISYRELMTKSAIIGNQLCGKTIVALMLPNTWEYISAFWACLYCGITVFPLNVQLTCHEVIPLLEYACITTVITSKEYSHIFDNTSIELILLENLPKQVPKTSLHINSKDKNRTAVLLSTSGTSGNPKIVRLSENNIHTSVLGYIDKVKLDNKCKFFLSVPFCSSHGLMTLSACLSLCVPLVIQDGIFTLDSFFSAAQKYKITHYDGNATPILLLDKILGRKIPYNLDCLRFFGFGGSQISGDIIRRVSNAFPQWGFNQGYGMTEAGPLIAKHPAVIPMLSEKADSSGTAINGVEIYILAGDTITQAPGKKGEILVKGANVMKGYLNNDIETRLALKDGFLHTGDIGYLDEDGYLYVCGRKKSMIIVRGFKVCPEEVESCINASSLVSDCRVYSSFDRQKNEAVWADVVLSSNNVSPSDIIDYCKKHLAPYKCPSKIIACASIAKNVSGKTSRCEENL